MNTQKSALNKISNIEKPEQVELSEHRIDLSLVADIDKAFDKAIRSEQNIAKLAQSLELDAKSASNDYQIVINLGQRALQSAKELGADDIVRVIQSRISDAEVSKKEMDSIVSKVKSMIV